MKKEITYCDICKKEIDNRSKTKIMQVIFETEQDEGRSCDPYFENNVKVDLCKQCNDMALEGNYIFASGAMGYNKYYFK